MSDDLFDDIEQEALPERYQLKVFNDYQIIDRRNIQENADAFMTTVNEFIDGDRDILSVDYREPQIEHSMNKQYKVFREAVVLYREEGP